MLRNVQTYVVRAENALSTLALHQLGPFTEVLSALGQALKLDSRSILLALTRFAGVMQAGVPAVPSAAPSAESSASASAVGLAPKVNRDSYLKVSTPTSNGRPVTGESGRALSPLRK